jgi:predicted ATPase
MREIKGISDLFQTFEALREKNPSPINFADLEFLHGLYKVQTGAVEAGINQIARGIESYRACGTRLMLSIKFALLAEANLAIGHFDQVAQSLQLAQDFVDEMDERIYQAEVLRLKGILLEHTNQRQEAESHFLHAQQVAREQKAKALELRAALSLARLWQGQGRRDEAYQVLTEVYSWFTEGFHTTDLQEAKALLESLH